MDRVLRERLAVDLAGLLGRHHDHDEAFTLADRFAIVARGAVWQVDMPDQLWGRPVDDEAAESLGCTTFLSERVSGGVASCAPGSVDVDAEDGAARLGFRASGVRAARTDPGTTDDGAVLGEVSERVHRHDHVRLAVEVPEVGRGGGAHRGRTDRR